MPDLKALLQKTMIFTAAAPVDLYASKLGPSDPIVPVPPTPTTSGSEEDRPVWNWTHDPSAPAKITNVTAIVRAMNNMTMPVCDTIEVERVAITVSRNKGTPVSLPLDVDHVVAKFKLDQGHIPDSNAGWWRIEANVDWCMAVVFAYEVIREVTTYGGLKDPPKIQKVSLTDLELDSAFPNANVSSSDPDYIDPSTMPSPAPAGSAGDPRTLENTVTAVPPRHFVVVVFGFSTGKERTDFEPGGVLGAGRFYPHVMVLSSQTMAAAEATIRLQRPATGMVDDDMNGQIGPLLASDANTMHGPLPLWSNVFDYVVTDPVGKIGLVSPGDLDASGANWMTVVDPTKGLRTIVGKIKRETVTHVPSLVETADFSKMPSQGEFDNLHLAPGMIYDSLFEAKQTNIKMAPFCVHDCMHTHFRWGNFLAAVMPSLPKSNRGFSGRTPYAGDGSPLVPFDQTVQIGLTSSHGFRYRAKAPSAAGGCVIPSTWTVFNHHGSGYALGVGSNLKWWGARSGVMASVVAKQEPYTTLGFPPTVPPMVTSFNPVTSVGAFYFRLRFTGYSAAGAWIERLQILDLSTTTGVRS